MRSPLALALLAAATVPEPQPAQPGAPSAMARLGARRRVGGVMVKKQWIAHDGTKARLRRLRQITRGLQMTAAQQARIDQHVASTPGANADGTRLMVLAKAKALVDSQRVDLSFTAAVDHVLERMA